jgi:hypothetical protein
LFEGVLEEEQLCLYVDSGALRRGREPGEADLNGIEFGATWPWSWIPVGRAPHGPLVAPADLGKGNELASFSPLELGAEVLVDLSPTRHPGEAVGGTILVCSTCKVGRMKLW